MQIVHFLRFFSASILSLWVVSCATAAKVNYSETDYNPIVVLSELTEAPLSEPARELDFDRGIASWYGPKFHGRRTANGETYDQNEFTAAHRTLPFNTLVRVENLSNGKSVVVRINDRGPYIGDRIIDLSRKAAHHIDMVSIGTTEVNLIILDPDVEFVKEDFLLERFTLQIGSFSKVDHAQLISNDLPGSRVAEVQIDDRTYFRVYYGLFATRREAEDVMQFIVRKGHTGFVKQI
jgi:rare lipoprotein A